MMAIERDLRAARGDIAALAWESIRHGLAHGGPAPPPARGGDGVLAAPGAAFVTLTRGGRLRGCIGSATAWRPLGHDVSDNAFKAAFRDPRFPPLRPDERDGLTVTVSVLTPPHPIDFSSETDLLGQLRPHRDGLIIEDGDRRALFLPSVWDQLPDPRGFLAHLKIKAGLASTHWSPRFRASRFEAIELDGNEAPPPTTG